MWNSSLVRMTCQSYRQSGARCLSFSRMLDMGGMPSASNDQSMLRTVNASKNSKLQAVAFDFEALTRAIEQSQGDTKQTPATKSKQEKLSPVQPDMDKIQNVASLLNVSVETGSKKVSKPKEVPKLPPGVNDIRAKYAAKLKGGLAGIELAKSQVEETLQAGDAAGHLAARQMAIQNTAASKTKWMALTGTGKLLSYLTHRSIRIALLPNPGQKDEEGLAMEQKQMDDFGNQLKDIIVDCKVILDKSKPLDKSLQQKVLDELDIDPNRVLIVSDRDDYLRAGRDVGMMTCRLQPKNSRRGNVSTHYTTPSIPEVQDVVNEINGISFNAVLNR